MTNTKTKSDPKHHAQKIEGMLSQIIEHVRGDVGKVTDPKFQALLETSAEVLIGLRTAYEHFEEKREPAFA